jgi:hypothetical protein
MLDIDNLFNSCSLGVGGAPNLILTDQVTHELFAHAMYQKYRQVNKDMNFQFDNIVYRGAKVVLDEKTPDAEAGTVTLTQGSMYMLNLKFIGLTYDSETDFVMTDFQKPTNGDSRIAHILWMGAMHVSNRRKQGVMGSIATSLT